jgi:hypothetical protein
MNHRMQMRLGWDDMGFMCTGGYTAIMSKYGMSLTDNGGVVRVVYYNVIVMKMCDLRMT